LRGTYWYWVLCLWREMANWPTAKSNNSSHGSTIFLGLTRTRDLSTGELKVNDQTNEVYIPAENVCSIEVPTVVRLHLCMRELPIRVQRTFSAPQRSSSLTVPPKKPFSIKWYNNIEGLYCWMCWCFVGDGLTITTLRCPRHSHLLFNSTCGIEVFYLS
jgi:hypothetical protein